MAAGDTSRIDIETLRVQWSSHSSYAEICSFWTVTRDQLIRLRCVLPLPPRHDRRLRHRPERAAPPTPEEIAASEASLDLAPAVAARVTCVQITWDDRTRAERQVTKPTMFTLQEIEVPEEAREFFDDLNRDTRW
ncbi:MAG: hypothetical protein EBR82_86150 [Caulobacteraceae bacterium]|nr:hypothetical protein [Caulobacteraceae bacterium]